MVIGIFITHFEIIWLPWWLSGKEPINVGDVGLFLGREDPQEKEMETHSSILPGKSRGQPMRSQKSRTQLKDSTTYLLVLFIAKDKFHSVWGISENLLALGINIKSLPY